MAIRRQKSVTKLLTIVPVATSPGGDLIAMGMPAAGATIHHPRANTAVWPVTKPAGQDTPESVTKTTFGCRFKRMAQHMR